MAATIVEKPIFKPNISFQIEADTLEERSTIVHCTVKADEFWPTGIRIWPTTFLIQENGERKKLLQAYNIAPYPNWKWVLNGHVFTLIFEGLSKDCMLFDLLEDIPQPGGFHIENIERNKLDVYWVEIDGTL
jgi:hypothetical protein